MNKNSNRTTTLIRDTGLFAISSFGSKVLIFLLTPLYTYILSTEEFGVADLINTTINFIYPILTLAIADATLRFAMEKGVDKNAVFTNSIFLTLISVLVLACFYPLIHRLSSDVSDYWLIFIITYALFNIHNAFSSFVKALGKTSIFAIQGVLQTVSIIASNILLLLYFKFGLIGYLISIIIGFIIPIIYMMISGKLFQYLFPIRFDRKIMNEMLRYSIPMIPTLLAWAFNTSIDKYMIIYMVGLSDSGIYSVAHKIPTIFTTVVTIFTQAWQLSAISNYGSKDESEFHTTVYNGLNLISLIGCMFIIVLSKLFASFLFSKDFFVAWKYVPFLTISAMFAALGGFLASEFRAAKQTKSLFVSVVVGSVSNMVLNWIFISILGTFGAAVATAIGFFIIWIFRFVLIQKIVKVKINILKTVVCYILFIVEAILVILEFSYSYIICPILIITVVLINLSGLKDMILKFHALFIKRKDGKKTVC